MNKIIVNSQNSAIILEIVDKDNYLDCIHLELHPEQYRNTASNAVTIAQSKFEPHFQLRAVKYHDKVIGMLAFCHETEPVDLTHFWLFRGMLSKDFQNKGIAQIVLNMVKREVIEQGAKRLDTMCKSSNQQALASYKKFGFQEIGFLDDGDIHLTLALA